ncbi:MAG: YfjI family protein [Planctomycetaceae bacterium]
MVTTTESPIEGIRRGLKTLFQPGDVFEVRSLNVKPSHGRGKPFTSAGYFDDFDKAAKAIAEIDRDGKPSGVYVTMNPPDPALLARAANRLEHHAGTTTSDANITARRWLLVDLDCDRPAKISASDDEKRAARLVAMRLAAHLRDEHGWADPVEADSGNGFHLLYRIDLPNDDDAKRLVEGTLKGLAAIVAGWADDGPTVKVDTAVGNAARITKAYGTTARKGDDIEARPHRRSGIINAPADPEIVTVAALQAITVAATENTANGKPTFHSTTTARPTSNGSNGALDVARWLTDRGIGHQAADDGTKYVLDECPFNPDHKAPDAAIFRFNTGATGFKCFHDSCADKRWADARDAIGKPTAEHYDFDDHGVDLSGFKVNGRPFGKAPEVEPRDDIDEPTDDLPDDRPRWQPFPVDALPEAVGNYVRALATAIGCDAAYIALPLLACLARAIGNRRVVRLKRTWIEAAILWIAIVGKSGTHKTPALKATTAILNRRQAKAIEDHKRALQQYETDKALYERELAAWKRSKTEDPPPWEPEEPVCERFLTSDATIEALVDRLASQFDGLLVMRDELAGWLGGIAEYKGGRGSDLGHWLASWSGEPITVDRKTGLRKLLHCPRAAVSLAGGIQPGVLRSAIGREHLQDGLCARLLLTMPPSRPIRWRDEIVDPAIERDLEAVFSRLFALEPAADPDGNPAPFPVDLSPAAKSIWIEYYDRHRAELAELNDDLAAAWSKLEAYAARLALIFALCDGRDEIDADSITNAIRLTDWFGNEARRVYGLFGETDDDRDRREVIDLIERRGGRITERELSRSGPRRFREPGAAETALQGLVATGLARWEHIRTTDRGGRPTRVCVLVTLATEPKPPRTPNESGVSSPANTVPDEAADDDEVIF